MKPGTVAIIQARMGSTRFPGKVMMTLAGRPIFAYLVERISRSRTLDSILVATTTDTRDNVIVEECVHRGIPWFRGSEGDVLGRYVAAAKAANAGIIVRVTADNPFTDPDSIDRVVDTIAGDAADYAIEMSLPTGTTGEALTRNALALIDSVANTARWREHVTLFAKENSHTLNCAFLDPRPGCGRPDLSFTVDNLSDYVYNQQVIEKLPNENFSLKNLIAVADELSVKEPAIPILF